jgi:hypothetical protein
MEARVRALDRFWRAARRASVDSARAFRKAALRISLMGFAMLAAEMVYELPASGGFHLAMSRAADGQYPDEAIIGTLLGTLVVPLPYALVGVAARAGLARWYFAAQGARRPAPAPFLPLFLVDLLVSVALTLAGILGAIPGLIGVLIASFADAPRAIILGFCAAIWGATAAVAYVLPGTVFATRMMVLAGVPARQAIRDSWAFARGRRLRLLVLVLLAYAFEAVGLVGVFVYAFGLLVTLPVARAFRDTLLTQIYLDVADDDEVSRRVASGIRVFLRR